MAHAATATWELPPASSFTNPGRPPRPPPQPPAAAARGAAQLADALLVAQGARVGGGAVAAPPGFLEDFAAKCDALGDVLKPVGEHPEAASRLAREQRGRSRASA